MSEERFQPRPMYGVIGGYGGYWTPVAKRAYIPYFTYYAMSRTAMVIQDLAMKGLIVGNVGELQTNLNLMLTADFSQVTAQASAGETGDVEKLKANLLHVYHGLYENWKAGIWHGVGSSYSSAMEQFMATGQYLYAYKALAVQTAVTPRLRRHWMKTYTPSVPSMPMAWLLWKRKVFKEADFDKYASYEGWPKNYLPFVKKAFERWPNIWQSIRLYYLGQLNRTQVKAYFTAEGWPDGWDSHFFHLYRTLPSPYQAGRMYLRSAISEHEYMDYAFRNGMWVEDAEKFMVNMLAYPTPREANYMWRRQFIDKPTRNKFYKAQGYLESMHELISKNFTQIFNPLNAFKLRMRGALGFTDYAQAVYENRWGREQVGLFDALYQNIPTSQEAFYMWSKGLLTVGQRDAAYKAYGWMPKWHSKLTENYYYVPTVYDLFRIADAVELDEIWAADIMTRRGIRPSDQAKLWPMLKIRPLRDEIVRQVYIWVRRYELGWASDVQLEAALDAMIADGYIQSTEKTLITEESHLKYENELMAEQIVIYMWYFRMAVITETQYLDALIALGIRREKANLMVEEQKAMGYFGYY